MKHVIFFLALLLSSTVYGQLDTIFKANGEILPIQIREISESNVKYSYPNESFSISLNKEEISKIHFASGRMQTFSSKFNYEEVHSCLDWKKVQISNIESEIAGLQKISLVGAKAKGMTTLSSTVKLQDRAYKKLKIIAAMQGANVIYVIEQNVEEAIYGGENAPSKTPGVTISGNCYTSHKIHLNEVHSGQYRLLAMYRLQANAYEHEHVITPPETVQIKREHVKTENGSLSLMMNSPAVPKVKNYKIIHADEKHIILSGIHTSKQGKKTYYNLILNRNVG